MVRCLAIFCVVVFSVFSIAKEPPLPREIAQFQSPPKSFAPWFFWFWFDNAVKTSDLLQEIKEMERAGVAGYEIRFINLVWLPDRIKKQMFEKSGHQPLDFLSDPFLEKLEFVLSESKKRGLKVAINLGEGWPPGGTWIDERVRSKKLLFKSRRVQGPLTLDPDPRKHFSEVESWKNPQMVVWSLKNGGVQSGSFQKFHSSGSSIPLESGDYLLGVYDIGLGGGLDKGRGFPADPASGRAMDFHLKTYFEKLGRRVARYYGNTLVEISSDSWEYQLDENPFWSTDLGDEAEAYLYHFNKEFSTPESRQALRRLQNEKLQQNFFRKVTEFVNQKGLKHKAQVYGRGLFRDYFQAYLNVDVPEMEGLVKEGIWVSRTHDKPLASKESLTNLSRGEKHFEGHPHWYYQRMSEDMARGINRFVIHSFSYSPESLGPLGFVMYAPSHFNRNNVWWPYTKDFFQWVHRSQYLMQSGIPHSDLLVYPEVTSYEHSTHHTQPWYAGEAWDGRDATSKELLHSDQFVLNDPTKYRVDHVLIKEPLTTKTELSVFQRYLKSGGTLLSLHPWTQWPILKSHPEVIDELKGFQSQGRLRMVMKNRPHRSIDAIHRSVASATFHPQGDVHYARRRVGEGELYFFFNGSDQPYRGWVAKKGFQKVTRLNPETGDQTKISQARGTAKKNRWPISIPARGSRVYLFEKSDPSTKEMLPLAKVEEMSASAVGLDNSSWNLRVVPEWGVGLKQELNRKGQLNTELQWPKLKELKDYAGVVEYSNSLIVNKDWNPEATPVHLDLGQVWVLGDVIVNGRQACVLWRPPYRCEITSFLKAGKNQLVVKVPNLLKNHRKPYVEERDLDKKFPVWHSQGLQGPVKLLTTK